MLSAPWHFIVPACKYWNLHPIVSCYYSYLKATARARSEKASVKERVNTSKNFIAFGQQPNSFFHYKGLRNQLHGKAFDIKELQVFQADLQTNKISEYSDLTASLLILRFFRFPSSSNRKQLLSATRPVTAVTV